MILEREEREGGREREKGRGGEREGEISVAFHMCSDWESNPQHFGVQDDAPSN